MYISRFLSFLLLSSFLVIVSCEKLDLKKEVPTCIEQKIRKIKREEVRNPPAQVWEWKVDDKKYYYISSDCCDQYNYLFDDKCNVVCAPDGGISGKGDGKCLNFSTSIEKTLIWEDNR